jgi:hypothetical protein
LTMLQCGSNRPTSAESPTLRIKQANAKRQ